MRTATRRIAETLLPPSCLTGSAGTLVSVVNELSAGMDRAVVAIATNYSLSDPITHSVESSIQWQLRFVDSFMPSVRVNNLQFAFYLYRTD